MLKKTWNIIVGIICIIIDLISPIIYLIVPVGIPFLIIGSLIEVTLYGCAKGEAFLIGTNMNIFTYEGNLVCTGILLTLGMLVTIIHIVFLFIDSPSDKVKRKHVGTYDKDDLWIEI